MSKKKMSAKKKSTSKPVSKIVVEKKKEYNLSWLWYALIGLVLLGILFLAYDGITGNVITGNAFKDSVQTTWGDYIQPVLEYLVGYDMTGDTNNNYKMDDFFSMALLILIIVFSVVFITVKSIPFFNNSEHFWVVWVISIAISLLSVRFLSQEWLITILLPYSTFGIALSAGIPFALFFLLVKDWKSKTARKSAWIFFAVVFVFLYYSRSTIYESIAVAGKTHYQIYLWAALAAGLMFLLDGTIHEYLGKVARERIRVLGLKPAMVAIEDQKTQANAALKLDATGYHSRTPDSNGITGPEAYTRDMKYYEKMIRKLSRS
jgi:hypothetical protein